MMFNPWRSHGLYHPSDVSAALQYIAVSNGGLLLAMHMYHDRLKQSMGSDNMYNKGTRIIGMAVTTEQQHTATYQLQNINTCISSLAEKR